MSKTAGVVDAGGVDVLGVVCGKVDTNEVNVRVVAVASIALVVEGANVVLNGVDIRVVEATAVDVPNEVEEARMHIEKRGEGVGVSGQEI